MANEGQQRFLVASKILKTEFYVDGALSGGESSADALNKLNELSALLKTTGFHLRKFSFNSKELLAALASGGSDQRIGASVAYTIQSYTFQN